jgi:hypothetical protein
MIPAGVYSMSEDEYHNDPSGIPSLSSSIAKILIAETPLHAWNCHPKLNIDFQREEKEIFDRGTVAHALLLQGLEVGVVLDFPDWKTKRAQEERIALRQAGKVPILQKHWDVVRQMVARAKTQIAAHKEASNAFTAGKPEQTLIWEDDHGVICRARLDWLHDSHLIIDDYKSTGRDVNPANIGGKLDDWDIQEAFYRRGIKKLFGVDAQFRFIAQENMEPYALSVIAFGPDIQWLGDSKVQRAIDLWAKCLESGNWPGYPDRICYPMLPKWAEEEEVRRQEAAIGR